MSLSMAYQMGRNMNRSLFVSVTPGPSIEELADERIVSWTRDRRLLMGDLNQPGTAPLELERDDA